MPASDKALNELVALLFKAHPWHGVVPGDRAPRVVNTFIEIVPTDTVKFELSKTSGHLSLDRPQRSSSLCPMPYGFIPQTYCGDLVAARCAERTGGKGIKGDGDPLDICVLTEKTIAHSDFFVRAKPIGGLRMIDGNEADDKIVAVLDSDVAFDYIEDINDCPKGLLDRLRHYFLSYKRLPGDDDQHVVEIAETYGRDEAHEVIKRSFQDYQKKFGAPEERVTELRRLLLASATKKIGTGKKSSATKKKAKR